MVAQEAATATVATVNHSTESFETYLAKQPDQVKRMLSNLKAAEVDVDYWIDALNCRNVTIATDGLVAAQRGYFAT
eukprot:12720621-Ditylum_brightwellii.AAC.1